MNFVFSMGRWNAWLAGALAACDGGSVPADGHGRCSPAHALDRLGVAPQLVLRAAWQLAEHKAPCAEAPKHCAACRILLNPC